MSEPLFLESSLLLAVLNGDEERIQALLSQLLPGELRTLEEAAARLELLIICEQRRRDFLARNGGASDG